MKMVLDDALHKYPNLDRLLVTGDIEAFATLRRELEERGVLNRTLVLAGNHDDSANLCTVFPDACHQEQELIIPKHQTFFADSLKRPDGGKVAWRLLGLDSSHGKVYEAQLRRVETEFNDTRLAGMPTLLFVHHPPVKVGSYWDDRSGTLRNTNELAAALQTDNGSLRRLRAIFCGHVHWEGKAELGRRWEGDEIAPVPVHSTPATSKQYGPSVWDFSRSEWLWRYQYRDYSTGYRVIELGVDGTMITHIEQHNGKAAATIPCRPPRLAPSETQMVAEQLGLLDPCIQP
jgi:Icc protein